MSDLVITLTEGELRQKSNLSTDSPIIEFNSYQYKRGSTFSLGMRQQAITYCEKVAAKQLRSLIVEGPYSLTIWIQEKLSAINNNSISSTASIKSAVTESGVASDQDDSETKTTLKKYRGQTYEVNVPGASSAAQAQTNAPSKKVVKQYRGQTYEVEVPDYSAIKQKFSK